MQQPRLGHHPDRRQSVRERLHGLLATVGGQALLASSRKLCQQSGQRHAILALARLDVDQELAVREPGENFVERWHQPHTLATERKRLAAVRGVSESDVESLQRLERLGPDGAAAIGAKLQQRVVKHREAPVRGALDVELDDIGAVLERDFHRADGVLEERMLRRIDDLGRVFRPRQRRDRKRLRQAAVREQEWWPPRRTVKPGRVPHPERPQERQPHERHSPPAPHDVSSTTGGHGPSVSSRGRDGAAA